jgi:hypothetical protein
MEAREVKGLEIAAKSKLQKSGDRRFVPSQAGKGAYYTVKPDTAKPHCSCPDFESRQLRCKHLFAVEYVIQREFTFDEETQTETVTETVTVKQTYKQEWTAYNKAQTNEKDRFLSLLADLSKGMEEPIQENGRPRLSLADMVFASTFKVYSTVSSSRFMSDVRDAHHRGYLTRAPHYNSISRHLESPALTPFLKQLIELVVCRCKPLKKTLAVDSFGFSTCRFVQWNNAKYGDTKLQEKHEWIKVHLMCGVQTNIVTSIEVTDRLGAIAISSRHWLTLRRRTSK